MDERSLLHKLDIDISNSSLSKKQPAWNARGKKKSRSTEKR
jgi:hypothetical protein